MAAPDRPNIVLILADDTEPGALGCHGGPIPTPHIDRLAREGVDFTRHFCASSVSQPSRYSYFTGHYAGRCPDPVYRENHPESDVYSVEFNVYINERIPNLASILRDAGYRTGMAGKCHMSHMPASVHDSGIAPDADPDDPQVNIALADRQQRLNASVRQACGFDYAEGILWGNNARKPLKIHDAHHCEWQTQAALDFLDTCSAEQPFFLHYASTLMHGPDLMDTVRRDARYTPGGKLDRVPDCIGPREQLPQRAEAAGLPADNDTCSYLWLDDQVGAILDRLEQIGALDNTLVIFAADHGNEPGKSTCHEYGSRIPMLMRLPGRLPAGRACDAMTQNIDLLPTVLDLLNLDAPDHAMIDGRSVLPVVDDPEADWRDHVFLENGYLRAVRTDRHKYIAFRYPEHQLRKMRDGALDHAPTHYGKPPATMCAIALDWFGRDLYFAPDQLYDLFAEDEERTNLAADPAHADLLTEMKQRLAAHTASFDHPYPAEPDPFQTSDQFAALAARTERLAHDWVAPLNWWPKQFPWRQDHSRR
jgi:arylsulfatase A-like enzyme